MTEERPAHSKLGASGAERWMNCPGSVALLSELKLPESDEPEYRKLGTAAHEVACICLRNAFDAWELIGQTYICLVDEDMVDAVQMYLDECRSLPEGDTFIEYHVDAPEFHHDFYGTTDFACVSGTTLYVRDYKHGMGIAVDVENNPQIMYYAFGVLRHHPEII